MCEFIPEIRPKRITEECTDLKAHILAEYFFRLWKAPKKLLSYSDTFSDGNFNHGNANDIFGGLGEDFEVFGQASKSA